MGDELGGDAAARKEAKERGLRQQQWEHAFVVGFLNGLNAAREAILKQADQELAVQMLNRSGCRHLFCLNYRPGVKTFCSPQCRHDARAARHKKAS